MPALPFTLSDQEQRQLLDLAEGAIREQLGGSPAIPELDLKEACTLKREGCCFVSLHHGQTLRGCIGSVIAYQALADDVVEHAKAAAFKDPRFPPLSDRELHHLTLEISVLSPPQSIKSQSRHDVSEAIECLDHPGLILRSSGRRAVFLPQVWELLPGTELFLDHLLQKGGWTADSWPVGMQAEVFTVLNFSRVLE